MSEENLPCETCISLALCKTKVFHERKRITTENKIGNYVLNRETGFTSQEYWVIKPIMNQCDFIFNC